MKNLHIQKRLNGFKTEKMSGKLYRSIFIEHTKLTFGKSSRVRSEKHAYKKFGVFKFKDIEKMLPNGKDKSFMQQEFTKWKKSDIEIYQNAQICHERRLLGNLP